MLNGVYCQTGVICCVGKRAAVTVGLEPLTLGLYLEINVLEYSAAIVGQIRENQNLMAATKAQFIYLLYLFPFYLCLV